MLIAVSIPIPGTLFNKATLSRYVSVCDSCLTCLVTFKIEARRFLHSEINTDSDSSPPSSFISRLSSHFINLFDQWLLDFYTVLSLSPTLPWCAIDFCLFGFLMKVCK